MKCVNLLFRRTISTVEDNTKKYRKRTKTAAARHIIYIIKHALKCYDLAEALLSLVLLLLSPVAHELAG